MYKTEIPGMQFYTTEQSKYGTTIFLNKSQSSYRVDNFSQTQIEEDPQYFSEKTKDLQVTELGERFGVDQKKLLRKIDLCVLPPFALLYFVSFLNRSSFGLVWVDGIFESLNIDQLQLTAAYAAFFAPIICFQFFSNIILRVIKPHFWIAFSVLFYGTFNLASGFSKNYGTFVVCQFFHGLFQAGSETAVVYILAHYYERREAQRRFSGLYSVNCLGGMTANLISYGINNHVTNGHLHGYEPWRYLLIILGSITMGAAVILFLTVPDFPEGARFFNDNETFFIIKKLELYGGKSGYTLNTSAPEVFEVLKDSLIYLPAFAAFGIGFVSHAYSLFEPVIYQSLNFGTATTNLFSSFPWIVAFFWINVNSYLSDKFKIRYPFLFFNTLAVVIGALLIFCDKNKGRDHFKYAGNFMLISGAYSSMPILICWSSLNVCGHLRKSVITSLEVSIHDLGGLVALFAFYKNDSLFRQGFIAGFVFELICWAISIYYLYTLLKQNMKKRSNSYKSEFDLYSSRKKTIMGDKNPNYDYMY